MPNLDDQVAIRSGLNTRRRLRGLAAAVAVTAVALAACNDEGDEQVDSGAGPPSTDTSLATSPDVPDEPGELILIRTRMTRFDGKVLAGSVIGGSPFCAGGTVSHEFGSPDIGYPAINVFDCPDGQLQIAFGPGSDQMDDVVQTSGWEVLAGTGRFSGASGEGRMHVRWNRLGGSVGRETFRGRVLVP